MQFRDCCGRSSFSHNSDILVMSACLRTRVGGKKWNSSELRNSLTGNETDVGLMDPLELPNYLLIYFCVC